MKEASNIINATYEGLQHELDGLHGLLIIINTSSCNHHSVIKIKVHFKNARAVKLTLKNNYPNFIGEEKHRFKKELVKFVCGFSFFKSQEAFYLRH